MSCRAIDLKLQPAAHSGSDLRIATYTYGYQTDVYANMRETVTLYTGSDCLQSTVCLSPAEARELAAQLMKVADVCDEHRARRQSLEEIEEQLRDEDFDSSLVRFAHPDIVYCAPGQLSETAKAHPRKLVIATRDEVPA